jgi:hypothetical protein
MKTLLYNIYPDVYTTDISYFDAYYVYVEEFTNYLKNSELTCTVRLDVAEYGFKDVSEDNPSHFDAEDPCVHIAISGNHIADMEQQIKSIILKAPVFICNLFVVENEDILTPVTLWELDELSLESTTIEAKDLPHKKIFRVSESICTDKDSDTLHSESVSEESIIGEYPF